VLRPERLERLQSYRGLAALWTREKLTAEHLEFLRELPHGPISPMENVQLVHGSPRDEDEYILMASDAYEILPKCNCPTDFFWAHACPALPFAGK